MRAVLAFIAILASSAFTTWAQEPTPAPQYAKRYLYDCDAGEKTVEAKAWKDHLAIAKEGAKWKAGGRWQPAFDKYFGTDSKDDPMAKAIKNAQKNQVAVHQANWIWPQSWVYVYCKEKDGKSPYNKEKSYCDGTVYAYSFIVKGWFHNSYNIVFCDKYYNEKKEASDIIAQVKSGKKKDNDALWMWMAYGQTYYHEFMHFPSLVNDTLYNGPMADVIKPFQLELIARRFGAKGRYFYEAGQRLYLSSMYLADAYATAATMAYFMEQLKLGTVPTQPNPEAAAQSYTSGAHQLPDLDAHSPEYAKADLHYDATKEDWSFKAQGLTPDNLPLLYPESTISEQDFNALFQDGGANPSPPSANPPVPDQWNGPNGKVDKGKFQFFVLPNYSQPKRKRFGGPIAIPGQTFPIPQQDRKAATLEVFTQDGDKYKKVGPLQIDCTKGEDAWQYFEPGQINTKYGLSIQSGHACSGAKYDNNLDNIHVKYAAAYVNIAGELGRGQTCSAHDGGASCILSVA